MFIRKRQGQPYTGSAWTELTWNIYYLCFQTFTWFIAQEFEPFHYSLAGPQTRRGILVDDRLSGGNYAPLQNPPFSQTHFKSLPQQILNLTSDIEMKLDFAFQL